MYPKEFFLERFKDDATDDLVARYATAEITDAAREAILALLKERGVSAEALAALARQARKAAWRQTRGTTACDYCGSPARFSYVSDAGQRFCNQTCLRNTRLQEAAEDLPEQAIAQHAHAIRHAPCPVCQRSNGLVEARRYHRVWSALILTRWTTRTRLSCKSCGRKQNLVSAGFCLLFGWWGFPWGILMTPTQIVANLIELFRRDDPAEASAELIKTARLDLAAEAARKQA